MRASGKARLKTRRPEAGGAAHGSADRPAGQGPTGRHAAVHAGRQGAAHRTAGGAGRRRTRRLLRPHGRHRQALVPVSGRATGAAPGVS
ncbi:hypothetical protein G6F59_016758 [Rhizopus arrhizus]|nr:hypothetical protein G6F59_016758 [Rhizopus arrhizus]